MSVSIDERLARLCGGFRIFAFSQNIEEAKKEMAPEGAIDRLLGDLNKFYLNFVVSLRWGTKQRHVV